MTTTPILGITEVAQSQSNKELTINDAIRALENATQKKRSAVATAPTNLSAANYTGYFYHEFTGTPGAWTLNVPATERAFYVLNNTDGLATVQVTGGGGVSVEIADGEGRLLYCDGTDIFEIGGGSGAGGSEHLVALFVTGAGVDESKEITYIFTRAVTFETDLASSRARADTVHSGSFDVAISLEKNGTPFGTIEFFTATANAHFTATQTSFAAGDRLTFVMPADFADLAGIAITLVAEID